ncbi:MAG: PAS domain S-box protein [Proteobacteria bacterium]|nr:PAS domain S-box protein [Pseudomonadota bacterium]
MTSLLRPGRATAAPTLSGIDADLDDLFELSPQALLLFDETGRIVHLNAAMQPLADGASRMAELPEPLREALGWPERLPPVRQQREHTGWLTVAGRRLHLRLRVRGLRPRNTARWLVQAEDLRSADELALARHELAAVLDTVGAAVATHDPARGWVTTALPHSSDEPNAAQRGVSREVVESDTLPAYEQLQAALRQRQRTEVRFAVRHADLGRRWLSTRVQPEAGGGPLLTAVTRDVTTERRASREGERLSCVLEGASMGLAVLRGLTVLRASPRFDALLGRTEATPGALDALLLAAGVAPTQVVQAVAQWQASNTFDGTLTLARPSHAGPTRLGLRLTRTGGELTLAQLCDLSAQQAREAEVEHLTHERNLLFNQPGVGILIQRDGHITRANAALGELLGRPAEALRGMAVADLYADDRAHLAYGSQERRDLQHHGRSRGERQLRRADDSLIWVQASIHPLDPHDLAGGTLTVFVSAEDGRRARASLLVHTDRTRAILDSVLVGIVTVGTQGIEWMNRSARRMFGGELAEFLGQPIAVGAPPDEADHPLRRSDWLATLREGQSETFECRLAGRDGRAFWVVGNVVVTGRPEDEGGGQLTFALLDIQRRREAEQQIAQARASLQRIIETAPLAIALFDARTQQVLQLNQAMTAFARRPASDMLGRAPALWLPGAEAALLAGDLHLALSAQDAVRRELTRVAETGEPARVWDMRIVSLRASGGEEQVLLVASDVTEQRAAEQTRLDAAIAQRDMLVREVHHRIKNNLQGVAGLLQQNVQRHPEAAAAIAEAVGQVHAIAQVHGLQVGASGPLRVRRVIEAIASSVQRMFGQPIAFEVQGVAPHRFALSEADSIPIALTVNELLTNAIKHRQGEAPIGCTVTTGEDEVTVCITNPGGLAEGFNLDTVPAGISGLGLVRALLPRKGARMTLICVGDAVAAELHLTPPAVVVLDPL